MQFFDQPKWPQHCGHDIAIHPSTERVIQPSAHEAMDGVDALGVTIGYCRQTKQSNGEPCRVRFVYTRHLYPGGWGPIHRIRDGALIAGLISRLKQAKEIDWVLGSSDEFPYRLCKCLVQ